MSVRPNSQCGRILAVLNDGQPHSTAELYRRLGGMILHSRIAELRTHGYNVTCERLPGVKGAAGYVYRLTNPDRENAAYSHEATTRRFNALRDEYRGGRPWPEERFECNPDESAGLADPVDGNEVVLPWEDFDGRNDPEQRFALYKICPGDEREKVLVFSCQTPEAVGVGIVLNAREGMFLEDGQPCRIGLLDRQPECEECGGTGQSASVLNAPVRCGDCRGTGTKLTGTWLVLPWEASPRNLSDAGKALRRAQR